MKSKLSLVVSLCTTLSCLSQEVPPDSLQLLGEVRVRAFEQYRPANAATAPVRLINGINSDRNNRTSLVSSFNTISGVRMEERSPGSYRINIRGSSLRSPFGVRNVKVYWNDIPVTDPGGNTYFSQFAWNNFSSIELFKGPASSLYGAGTGGLLLLNSFDRWQAGASVEYVAGSYGLHNILASARFGGEDNKNVLTFSHTQSDGYRAQTNMRKDNVSWTSMLKNTERQQLTASFLYADMHYETPGALTLNEYNTNPRAARPATPVLPSAEAVDAAITQRTLLAGLSNNYSISADWRNTTTLYGAFAQVRNSAVRNYERRIEPHFGGRSVFVFAPSGKNISLVGGAEFQQGYFNVQVSDNVDGNPDELQTDDDINIGTWSVFTQADIEIAGDWTITAGASLSKSRVQFRRLNEYPVIRQSRTYENEIAPRLAVAKKITESFSVVGSVAKGFSPPTTAEVLPSTGVISTDLDAESGWNYELTARYSLLSKRLNVEATAFYFSLNNALVQRRDFSGGDFFTNAGSVKQRGLEGHVDYTITSRNSRLLQYIQLQTDITWNHFRYGSFVKDTIDFSGKTVPSVPATALSILGDVQFQKGWFVNVTYYGASRIYLNDANTARASGYRLLGARAGWKKNWSDRYRVSIYAGADNLLDEKYSLGNDINAAGGRYYNAAARRNYFVGIGLQWIRKKGQE